MDGLIPLGRTVAGVARPGALAGVVVVNAAAAALGVAYGLQHLVPPQWQGAADRAGALLLLGAMLAALALVWRTGPPRVGPHVPGWLVVALCLLQLTPTLFFNLPTRSALPAIAVVWAAAAGLARWRGSCAALLWVLGAGFAAWGAAVVLRPVVASEADMLPFIGRALDVFRAGGDPYTADYGDIDGNPFLYPPVQWLVFLPLHVLGLDFRLLNLLSAALMVLAVERSGPARLAGRLGVYPLMLGALTFPIMHAGQVWPYWLMTAAFGLLLLRGRFVAAAGVAALAVGTRQTALIPAVALLLALAGRIRWPAWLGTVAAAAATLAVTVVPFVSSAAALDVLVRSGPARALVLAHAAGNPLNQVALSNVADRLGFSAWDIRLEAVLGLLTVGAAVLAARRGVAAVLAVAGLGYVVTVSANPYLHRYYYVAGFMLAALGLAAQAVGGGVALPSGRGEAEHGAVAVDGAGLETAARGR